MDVGNPDYQAKWLGNVSSELKARGWDGVFVDDTDASLDWHLNGRTVARYPTDAAWRSATRSALAAIGPSLQSQGFLVVPNLYAPWKADYDAVATWKDWLQFTSGAAQEFYTKWGTSSAGWLTGNDWTWREQFQQATDAAGKIFLGLTYAPKSDQHSQLFARASFLLMDGGHGGALVFESSDPEAQDPYAAPWTADPGSPTGARYQVGSAWRRDFTGGTVVVNPTAVPVTVSLGGTFLAADGSSVNSVTLGAASGAILTNPGGPTDPGTGGGGGGGSGGSVPPPATTLTLSASPSGNYAKLTWTGSSAARIDVYRNARRVAQIANKGAYTDHPAKPPSGAYTYRVCEAGGTSVCSAAVTVTFPATATRAVTGEAVANSSRLHRLHLRAAHRPTAWPRRRERRTASAPSPTGGHPPVELHERLGRRHRRVPLEERLSPRPASLAARGLVAQQLRRRPREHRVVGRDDHAVVRLDALRARRRGDDRDAARHRFEHLHLHPAPAAKREEQHREAAQELAGGLDLAQHLDAVALEPERLRLPARHGQRRAGQPRRTAGQTAPTSSRIAAAVVGQSPEPMIPARGGPSSGAGS